MNLSRLAERIQRLTQLYLGLSQEHAASTQRDDPLLYLERHEYLAALRAAASRLEAARVVLLKARERLARRC
jgi:hypothetical protein